MPKTIAILAPSSVPFQVGGAEKFWWGLRGALGALPGCWAELVKLPTREESFADIVASYEMFSKLDLSHFDLLISTKYPAWIAPHPNHVCYMQHTLRGLYDTYHFTGLPEKLPSVPGPLRELVDIIRKPAPERSDLPLAFDLCRRALSAKSLPSALFAFPGPLIREVVHFLDRAALAPGQIKAWLAISATVAARRDYFPPGAHVAVLHHPSDMSRFACEKGEYFFTASRLNGSKRVGLIVDAMRHMPENVSLRIAGTGPDLEMLREKAAGDRRIEFLGHVADSEMSGLYAKAIAVPFTPYDEDYGLVTLEAFQSGKPVITVNDAGGVCELVRNGENGFVVEPTPPALGRAMSILARDRALAAKMGASGRQSVSHITWPEVAPRVLEAVRQMPPPKVVVACAFPADAAGTGGQRRLYHFCAELARTFRVELLSVGDKCRAKAERRQLAPGVAQTLLPWPKAAIADAEKLERQTGASADDIAILRHAADAPEILDALATAGQGAACAIASHPWLYRAILGALPDLPIIYDAHNVEADLKEAVLGRCEAAREAKLAEQELARSAALVFACSEADCKRLQELYGIAAPLLLPNGCEPRGRVRARAELRRRLAYPDTPLVLFVGSGHKPNIDAVLSIFDMARQLPDVQFLVAGNVCAQREVSNAQKPCNAHLLGKVSEKIKNVLLEAADVAINPVTSGSGVNLKIVEYLSFGIPCVCTPFGMRGMPGGLESAARVCELADFPRLIRETIDNMPDTKVLDEIAGSIRQSFAWPQILAPLGPALADILGKVHAADN